MIEYLNREFKAQRRSFSGLTARMIPHEYDHTQELLSFDYLAPLAKKLVEGKLKKIMKGQIPVSYPMKFV